MNYERFKNEIQPLWDIYRQDNAWVGKWEKSWNEAENMKMYVDAAWYLYEATSRNRLRITLLGGTDIRSCAKLIGSFGLTGANGIQDEKVQSEILNYASDRRRIAGGADPSVGPFDAVQKFGSILSEKNWTPLLNDALIIGSATAAHEFLLTLEPKEHGLWRDCEDEVSRLFQNHPGSKVGALRNTQDLLNYFQIQQKRAGGNQDKARIGETVTEFQNRFNSMSREFYHGGGREYSKHMWNVFMNRNIDMLWNRKDNIPRVFARELVGLSIFGYKPDFTYMQLGFSKPKGASLPAFSSYVRKLRELQFEKKNRFNIMKYISKFLFDDERAIFVPEDRVFVGVSVGELRKNFIG